jgi:hypothetical protein
LRSPAGARLYGLSLRSARSHRAPYKQNPDHGAGTKQSNFAPLPDDDESASLALDAAAAAPSTTALAALDPDDEEDDDEDDLFEVDEEDDDVWDFSMLFSTSACADVVHPRIATITAAARRKVRLIEQATCLVDSREKWAFHRRT